MMWKAFPVQMAVRKPSSPTLPLVVCSGDGKSGAHTTLQTGILPDNIFWGLLKNGQWFIIIIDRYGFKEVAMNTMPVSEIIEKVTAICKKNGVKRLDLFGSFATGTATPTSDIDFVVYGCDDMLKLEDDLMEIKTLRKIDIFDYDSIENTFLLEDIEKYGKQIY